ncbi:hypothetical protein B0H14DRAFT_3499930 [Mycena olivaceomarginata]|nr:hypothetical protein B0H14DRAFT_3499930 [Mycena olivaceomarginata]
MAFLHHLPIFPAVSAVLSLLLYLLRSSLSALMSIAFLFFSFRKYIIKPGHDQRSDAAVGDGYDLNSWGYKTDESSWGVETPVHNSDLNSWGCKTADSSWSGETPVQDSDLNSWGGCKTEGVWGSTSLSSDDSSSSTETASSQSSTPNHPQTDIRRLPPQTCRYWLRGTCYSGSRCKWIHPQILGPVAIGWRVIVTSALAVDGFHPVPSSTAVPKLETVSSSSFAPNHSQTEVNHHLLPHRIPQTCRNWLRVRGLAGTANYEPNIIIESTIIRRAQVEFSVDVTFVFHCNPVSNAYKTSAATKSRDLSQLAEGYLHPRHPPPPPPVEPPLSITVHDHTKVKIGPGFEIHDVLTSVETPWILLTNIPAHAKPNAIEQLLSPFGSVSDIQLPTNTAKDVVTAKARFASHAEATQASKALDGTMFLKSRISARVPVNSRSGIASIQDCSVRIQWEAPQKVAYGGYPSLKRAQEAIAAARKGQSGDYYVYAAVHVGIPSIGTATVKFTHLPPTATEDFMQRFAAPEDIMWERPNYTALTPAIDGIKRMLRNLGNFLELEVLPPPYSNGLIRAWATFSSATAAKAAAGALHGRKPVFTGKTRIFAHHVLNLGYHISFDDFPKNAQLIENLRESIFRDGMRMTISTRRLSSSMLVRLSAEGVKPLGWLKAEFEKILRGEILRRDGVIVWDFFFARPDGLDYLRSVEAKEPGVRIEADKVRRTLKIFGTPSDRTTVRAILLQKMSDLKTQQVRLIRVPGHVIGAFIATQLSRFCERFGNETIFVDNWERTVTLRGGDELYEAAVEAVHQAQQSPLAQRPYAQNVAECPWCRACLSQYLLAALDNRHFPLTCLGDEAKCTESISLSTARSVLQPDEFNSVVVASVSAYVHAHAKELHYCPSPDCIQIYRTGPKGTVVQCPSCLLRICSHCHAEAHDGFPCAEQQDGDKLFKEWVASHDVKNCPGCAIPIERDEGCHHVTTFPKGEGIYRHMREEHGGIGLAEHEYN